MALASGQRKIGARLAPPMYPALFIPRAFSGVIHSSVMMQTHSQGLRYVCLEEFRASPTVSMSAAISLTGYGISTIALSGGGHTGCALYDTMP